MEVMSASAYGGGGAGRGEEGERGEGGPSCSSVAPGSGRGAVQAPAGQAQAAGKK